MWTFPAPFSLREHRVFLSSPSPKLSGFDHIYIQHGYFFFQTHPHEDIPQRPYPWDSVGIVWEVVRQPARSPSWRGRRPSSGNRCSRRPSSWPHSPWALYSTPLDPTRGRVPAPIPAAVPPPHLPRARGPPTPFGATLLQVIGYIYEEQAALRLGGKYTRRYAMSGPRPGRRAPPPLTCLSVPWPWMHPSLPPIPHSC